MSQKSLSNFEVKELVKDVKFVPYDELVRIDDLRQLMGKDYKTPLAILYLTDENYGHWTCLFERDGKLSYFNSLGSEPDDDFKFIDPKMRKKLNEVEPKLFELLHNSGKECEYNNIRLQAKKVNTCGRHIVFRLWNRKLSPDEYLEIFDDSSMTPDELVVKETSQVLGSGYYEGGTLGEPLEDEYLDEKKTTGTITQEAKHIVDVMTIHDHDKVTGKYTIQGSFALKIQPYFADIDMLQILTYNYYLKDAIPMIIKDIKDVLIKASKMPGWYFSDFKAGKYSTGEDVHWTGREIFNGFRNETVSDLNGVAGKKTFESVFHEKSIIKLDLIVPYFNRYIEASCIYIFKTKEGFLNINATDLDIDTFLVQIKYDAYKKFSQHKIFKSIKRIYSQAVIKKDYPVMRIFAPILTSNVSKLSTIQADFETIQLLLKENQKFNLPRLYNEFQEIIERLFNITDIFIDPELNDHINLLYDLISMGSDIKAKEEVELIIDYLLKIVTNETIKWLISKKIKFPIKYI